MSKSQDILQTLEQTLFSHYPGLESVAAKKLLRTWVALNFDSQGGLQCLPTPVLPVSKLLNTGQLGENGKCRHGGGRQGARCVSHCGNSDCTGPVELAADVQCPNLTACFIVECEQNEHDSWARSSFDPPPSLEDYRVICHERPRERIFTMKCMCRTHQTLLMRVRTEERVTYEKA